MSNKELTDKQKSALADCIGYLLELNKNLKPSGANEGEADSIDAVLEPNQPALVPLQPKQGNQA